MSSTWYPTTRWRSRKQLRVYLAVVDRARVAQQMGKNRFVTANLRVVVSIARRYNRGRLP